MRLNLLLSTLLFISLNVCAVVKAQITIRVSNASFHEVLKEIERQTRNEYDFFYSDDILSAAKRVTANVDGPLDLVLKECFKGQPFAYEIIEKTITISLKPAPVVMQDTAAFVKVSGRILEAKDPPLPLVGATVLVKGSTNATKSDGNGSFSLNKVPLNSTITVSMIGYKSQDYIVRKEQLNLIISLQDNPTALEQVVITGFGKQKVREIASSVSTINLDNVVNKPVVQLSQALQGGTTGIVVQQTTGIVGGDQAQIRIRGVATVGDASPLVLVDGIPFDMNNLDPNTVASITVLKDAASASMYGSRGANGVILVTTKRGAAGVINVDYNGYYGIQKPMYLPDFVDAAKWMQMKNEASVNNGGNPVYTQDVIDSTARNLDPVKYPNTNWPDLVLRENIPIQQHSLMVSGGNTAARFVVAINHTRQLGQINDLGRDVPSMYSRSTVRLNTTVDLTKTLFVYADVFASRSDQTEPYINGGNRNTSYFYGKMYSAPPNVMARYPSRPADQLPDYIPAGYVFYGPFGESWNPAAMIEQGGTFRRARDQAIINIKPQWKITPYLSLNGQASYNVTSGLDKTDQLAYTFFNYKTFRPEGTTYGFTKTATLTGRENYFYWGGNFDYKQDFDQHSLNVIAGYTQELRTTNSWDDIALQSYFIKAYYTYADRYLLEAGVRRDGSSLFGDGNKWGSFPSVAVGWNIDKEPFFNVNAITGWKMRASYGVLGNNRIDPYKYQTSINSDGRERNIGNPLVKWEKNRTLNVGTDIYLKAGLSATVEWFNKKTSDVLITPSPYYTAGIGIDATTAAMPPLNVASIQIRGIEASLKYETALSKNLRINAGVGYTKNKSEVLKLVKAGVPIISGNQVMTEGGAFQEYYGYKSQGLLSQSDIDDPGVAKLVGQKAGDIRYIDVNGNKVIDQNDRVPLGSTQPTDIFFGNIGFNYKGFDFDMLVSGQTGSPLFYTGVFANPFTGVEDGTPQKSQTDTWRPDNPNARLPRLISGGNMEFSDFWKQNGAFLRFRYMQVGYTLPKSLGDKIRAKMLRVYFNMQNPFTISDVSLFDPESAGGATTVPPMKTFTFGLNVKL